MTAKTERRELPTDKTDVLTDIELSKVSGGVQKVRESVGGNGGAG